MKILQINAVYSLSSTGRTTKELQDYINNNTENECRSAFSYGGSEQDGFIIGSRFDRKEHGLMSRISGEQGHYSASATKKLINYIKDYKPDIIHFRNIHGNYINYPMLFRFIAINKIAVVITLHDCWFYTGKCMHYTTIGCNKWQSGCGNCPDIHSGNNSFFLDRTKKLLDEKKSFISSFDKLAVVGVSDWITKEVRKSLVIENADIVQRIYNWVDTDVFKPTDIKGSIKGVSDKDFVILGVSGIWDNKKGLNDFIELSQMLGSNMRIVLVGELKSNLNLPENIITVGKTDSVDELAQYYNRADCFVTFSKEETFGKVSAESLACGTPVICYNSTANPELVKDGCGYSVNVGDVQAVFDKISDIAENGKGFYTQKCIEFANTSFQKEKCIKQYIDLYHALLSTEE